MGKEGGKSDAPPALGGNKGLWVVLIVALVAVSLTGVGIDPFGCGIAAKYPDFKPTYGRLPPIVGMGGSATLPRDSTNRLQKAKVIPTTAFVGPESVAFDRDGRGPYTGAADGRIFRMDSDGAWTVFAYTSHNWSKACIPVNPRAPNIELEHICGRPLGLRFNKKSGDLYIADASFGLMVVGPEGGVATSLSSQAQGSPFKFTNDLDLDSEGFVYFTDTSSIYHRRDFIMTAYAWDTSGRLLRYDTKTKETIVLLRDLICPNGVSLSKDESFLVVAEGISTRLLKYWLRGEKAGTVDIFAIAPGHPDNVRRNEKGDFWVAMHCRRSPFLEFMGPKPWARKLIARMPIPLPYIYSLMLGSKAHAMIARFNSDGDLLEVLEDETGETVKLVSEVEERDGHLWIGSVVVPQIAVFNIANHG